MKKFKVPSTEIPWHPTVDATKCVGVEPVTSSVALDVWVGRNDTETESPEPIQLRSWLQFVRSPASGRGYCISASVGSKGVSVGEVPVMTRVLRKHQVTTVCQEAAR